MTSRDPDYLAKLECIVPSHHVGRQKGVKNKRKGLEKALHQIEEAIKRPKTDDAGSSGAQNIISNLQVLLNKIQGQRLPSETDYQSEDPDRSRAVQSPDETNADDSLSLDDAENPLQLLARASDLQLSPPEAHGTVKWLPLASSEPASAPRDSLNGNSTAARSFFVPAKARLDTGPEIDPIDLGLVTSIEADTLFSFFYQNLAHTRWGLDPLLHTVPFVRAQSAFLFTSIMAAAALFLPSAAALSKRLSRHCKSLAQRVITERLRSVEIVLAFMVNVPWMAPGSCLGDDDTCHYIGMALTVALDLSLNKIVLPSTSFESGLLKRLAKADSIDARRALNIDGVCLAHGRSYTVPPTSLIENCDVWHVSDFADSRDGPLNSMAVLRRNLDELFHRVKSVCDGHQIADTGSEAAQSIQAMIESFYNKWYEAWAPAIGEGHMQSLPPYVEILVTHTQLSTYGGVINHPTAPLEVKRFFRAAGLSSALNVLRAAIQGESRLKSMPNNTVIMISYAACSALSLSEMPADSRSSLAPSVRNLIEEAAGVLERIGATPNHRSGTSFLYGRFLRELVRRSPANPSTVAQPASHPVTSTESLPPPSTLNGYGPVASSAQPPFEPPLFWSEPLQFSAMSDDQIIDAVNRAGTAFGTSVPDVPLDDMMNWEWLDLGNTTDFSF
ncbi:hypothetical protein N8T08_002456 [Aspergillus melleus]|uniref:Uncharacterized protein n=1 Tax=Aspergillus melleus TaxID=138277 RepID=A0ACC3ALX5_9EURO|nr:hypothetical protein N8T08_002456 [Aspergillus melleus]